MAQKNGVKYLTLFLFLISATFTYKTFSNGEKLQDVTSDGGEQWITEKTVTAIEIKSVGSYTGDAAWANFEGRWGNQEAECFTADLISLHECVLNQGPKGPGVKIPNL